MFIINFSSSLKVLGVKTKITNVFDSIKGGEYANDISIYRDMLKNDKEMANNYKKQLACFTVSGCFIDKRNASNLENYNSIIHLDYDLKDEDKAKGIVDLANEIPYTYCSFISPSFGYGCVYQCGYCYMKRHKPTGLDVATNTGDILTVINSHVYFTPVDKPNQTHKS